MTFTIGTLEISFSVKSIKPEKKVLIVFKKLEEKMKREYGFPLREFRAHGYIFPKIEAIKMLRDEYGYTRDEHGRSVCRLGLKEAKEAVELEMLRRGY